MTNSETAFKMNDAQKAAMGLVQRPGWSGSIVGYAGTGKTTVLQRAGLFDTMVLAPTNKAAGVLRAKGLTSARTIHSAVYRIDGFDENGDPVFSAREERTSVPKIVIDEASMVTREMLADIIEVLNPASLVFVGDGFQLPPVSGAPVLPEVGDVNLTDVYRQEKGSEVLDFATRLRSGECPRVKDYFDRVSKRDETLIEAVLAGNAVMICRTNAARVDFINYIRRLVFGHQLAPPQVGEPLIAYARGKTTSSIGASFYSSGDTAVITAVKRHHDQPGVYWVELYGLVGEVLLDTDDMLDPFQQRKRNTPSASRNGAWTYACAVTAHKAQGSQWPVVLINPDYPTTLEAKRWLYTAVTRAQDKVFLI